jgi:hypothetical protein
MDNYDLSIPLYIESFFFTAGATSSELANVPIIFMKHKVFVWSNFSRRKRSRGPVY